MHILNRRISPSMMIAFVALFIALCGGTAIAQSELITSSAQIKDGVVTLNDQREEVVAAGVNKGLGIGGAPFLTNATSEAVSVELASPSGARFEVRFDRPIRHCQWVATQQRISGSGQPQGALFQIEASKTDSAVVNVYTKQIVAGESVPEPISFFLLGRC